MKKGQAAVISRKWDAQELEASARGESNARVCRRLLALRQLALGHSIEQASQVWLVSVSQIYNWIRRYEEQGIEGMLKLSNLVPRPQHPDSDAGAQAAFKRSAGQTAGPGASPAP